MNPKLSVVLPVHNVQHRLSDRVHRLLEILPELTEAFDLLIVNDGSTDQTNEVAAELAREYPQVRVANHVARYGHSTAVATGLRKTAGDVVIVQSERAPISPEEIRRLWNLRVDQRLVMASGQADHRVDAGRLVDRLTTWADQPNESDEKDASDGGTHLIRRRSVEELGKYGKPADHLLIQDQSRADAGHDRDLNPTFQVLLCDTDQAIV